LLVKFSASTGAVQCISFAHSFGVILLIEDCES